MARAPRCVDRIQVRTILAVCAVRPPP
jgi:hypothetical protein